MTLSKESEELAKMKYELAVEQIKKKLSGETTTDRVPYANKFPAGPRGSQVASAKT
jgi:hypothetical protein